jgi:iron(III) transport system substrate-binding protein
MLRSFLAACLAIGFALCAGNAHAAEVTVYTTREPGLLKPLLDNWRMHSGVMVNTVFLQGGLAERLQSEGPRSPADLVIVVDAGTLIDLVKRDLTQPIRSEAVEAAVPSGLRDPKGHWFALSMRPRVIFVSKDRVPATENPTYEDLASARWTGKVCIRSGQHPYNTALFSAMLKKHGEEKLATYLTALRGNLAHKPSGGDRDVAKDILAGDCDAGVANLYYAGLMLSGAGGLEQKRWGEAIRVVMPTFSDKVGTHVNIAGAAVAKHAPNREEAIRLLDFLTTAESQRWFTQTNFETAVRSDVEPPALLAEFGSVRPDNVTPAQIAEGRETASRVVDRVGFDR